MNDNYFMETNNHEWLLTNKIGGYALGTGNLINQRKYHGLLIVSDDKLNRNHLLSCLEILVEWRGETFHLDSTNYSSCIYPEGFLHLVKSWLAPYPAFLYSSLHHNNDILVLMEILMADNENSVLVRLTNLGSHQLNFVLRPKVTLRNHHHINPSGCWDNEFYKNKIGDKSFSMSRTSNGLSLGFSIGKGNISAEHVVYRNCYYPWEAIRGYYGVEDLVSPCKIAFSLKIGEENSLLFSDNISSVFSTDWHKRTLIKITEKYKDLPLPKDLRDNKTARGNLLEKLDYDDQIMFDYPDYLKLLEQSLSHFLLQDNIIAGYPWFGCWGRDTFITMSALLADEKNYRLCWKIIKNYGRLIKDGLLPNMLPESGQEGNYTTIDASLWFVLRIYDLVSLLENNDLYGKKTIIRESVKLSSQVINGLLENTTFPFSIGSDGLIYLEEGFAASTWMDAKVEGRAITPRTGAPVEINALFYNALCSHKQLVDKYEKKTGDSLLKSKIEKLIKIIPDSFQKFWIGDYLADRIVDGKPVKEYRPNALIATSLKFPLISTAKMQTIITTASKQLLTPYGLRTLTPRDHRFKKKYLGNVEERDKQYHQGTVWAFLLDFYAQTYINAYQETKTTSEMVNDLVKIVASLRNGFMKGHIRSVAEVWDGDKSHFPKGCPAQAWSVAALYRIEHLINRLISSD
jgi:predicted glycogen debranching enzyme